MMVDSFDNLYSDIRECKKCEIGKCAKNKVIFRGVSRPVVVFVGEAPGEDEDIKGIPFCGRSGKVLDEAIKEAGISPNAYTIINVCKCRPTNVISTFKTENRVPTHEEVENCSEFLVRQFVLLKPKIIVCLGKTACGEVILIANRVAERMNISDVKIIEMSHPAYTLYKPETRESFFQAIKDIKKFVDIMSAKRRDDLSAYR